MLVAVMMLLRRADGRPLAVWWVTLLAFAVALTLVTKVAFIGWGVGSAALNFTGISGHSVLAAAVYPLLFAALASHASRRIQTAAIVVGCLIAVMVGISRLIVGVHSESEVLAGLLLGGLTSAAAASSNPMPRAVVRPLIPAVVALWLAWTPVHSPASPAHGMVIQLSLKLSGNSQPYTRRDMLRISRTYGWVMCPPRSKKAPSGFTAKCLLHISNFGSSTWARTRDLRINSRKQHGPVDMSLLASH
jgi:hypothetical protein